MILGKRFKIHVFDVLFSLYGMLLAIIGCPKFKQYLVFIWATQLMYYFRCYPPTNSILYTLRFCNHKTLSFFCIWCLKSIFSIKIQISSEICYFSVVPFFNEMDLENCQFMVCKKTTKIKTFHTQIAPQRAVCCKNVFKMRGIFSAAVPKWFSWHIYYLKHCYVKLHFSNSFLRIS